MSPVLSIVVPTWNRLMEVERLVEGCGNWADSPLVEIVVVDNASPKSIVQGLERLCTRHKSTRLVKGSVNIGMVGNWNRALSEAQGTWVTMVCSDDILPESSVGWFLAIERSLKSPCLVVHNPEISVSMKVNEPGPETVGTLRLPIASGNIIHRRILGSLGGFDQQIKYSPDGEYWYRIASRFPVVETVHPLAEYTEHEDNYAYATWRANDFLSQAEVVAEKLYPYFNSGQDSRQEFVRRYLESTVATVVSIAAGKPRLRDVFRRYRTVARRMYQVHPSAALEELLRALDSTRLGVKSRLAGTVQRGVAALRKSVQRVFR